MTNVFHFENLVYPRVLQLKKLVYVYLVRYAEEQQDLALLSISTFQRALKVNPSDFNSHIPRIV